MGVIGVWKVVLGRFGGVGSALMGVLGAFERWCLKRIIKQSLQDVSIWVKR